MLKRSLYIIIFLGLAQSAWAGERYEFYNGIRALSMGGAAVAVVNDETALLSNPAGLGKLRDYFITIADPEGDVGAESEAIVGTDVMDALEPQSALDKCKVNKGKYLHLRGQVFPSLVVPNFGVGIFAKNEVNAEVNEANTDFKYHYRSDFAGVFGFNLRIWDGIIKIGANARIINRTEIMEDDLNPAATNLTFDSLAASGMGIGSDGGIILTAPIAWLPSIGAVYRDIGRTSFRLRDGLFTKTTNDPASVKESLDVAVAINPILGNSVRSSWTVEMRDVMSEDTTEAAARKLHGGVELNFADAFFLRAGANQGYWTAGFELSMLNYQFQVATYGEEIGDDTTKRQDRRYVAKFALRF